MINEKYMQLALNLIEATAGQTSPNPAVGAVIVKDNQIIGLGAHLQAGQAHAEVQALEMAGGKARGATLYVTLEPCHHKGRTGPCTAAIIDSGLVTIVVGTLDPNPLVSGKGVEALEAAGLDVTVGFLKDQIVKVNRTYRHFMEKSRPYVTLKTAMSLDGKIATHTGDSQWITGQTARADVHHYRHRYDAILVGVGTVLADNPRLTTRLPGGGRQPIRIILDRHLRTPAEAEVVTDTATETWIFTMKIDPVKLAALKRPHLRIVEMTDLEAIIAYLGRQGITSVLIEGGGTINASFLHAGLVDELVVYLAPKLIGGQAAPTFFEGVGIEKMTEVMNYRFEKIEKIGEDLKLIAYPK